MNLKKSTFLIVCLLFFFSTPVYGKTKKEIDVLIRLMQRNFSLRIYYKIRVSTAWKLNYKLASPADYESLYNYLKIFHEEFQKYPKSFIKKTKLRTVAFVKELQIRKKKREAIPDYYREILFYDFQTISQAPKTYIRHIIHHEYYHMIEQEFNGSAFWKDPTWKKFNIPGFKYGKGGLAYREGEYKKIFKQGLKKGFATYYSMSGLEEDKAEIFACLFAKASRKKLDDLKKEDIILKAKVQYMKNFLARKDNTLHEGYWKELKEKLAKEKP